MSLKLSLIDLKLLEQKITLPTIFVLDLNVIFNFGRVQYLTLCGVWFEF